MTENFEYFTIKYLEYQNINETFQEKMKIDDTKITSSNVFLKEILKFDIFKVFSDLIEFNKKLWSKLLFVSFDKIDFDTLNKFFNENYQKLNNSRIKELRKQINNLEIENGILKIELEKILLNKNSNNNEKIRHIINSSLNKNRQIFLNNKNEFNNDRSINLNNSLGSIKSSFRRKNHSKNIFVGYNNNKNKKFSNDKKKYFDNNSSNSEIKCKSIIDKDSFNKLDFNSDINYKNNYASNDIYNPSSYKHFTSNYNSDPNNIKFVNYSGDINNISYKINSNYYIPPKTEDSKIVYKYLSPAEYVETESKQMIDNIFDKYKNEDTNLSNLNNTYSYYHNNYGIKYEKDYIIPNTISNYNKVNYVDGNSNYLSNNIITSGNYSNLYSNNAYGVNSLNLTNNLNNYNTITNIATPSYKYEPIKYENKNFNTEENVNNKSNIYYTCNYLNDNKTFNKNNSGHEKINKIETENKAFLTNIDTFSADNRNINYTNRSIKSTDFNNQNFIDNNKDISFLSSNNMKNENDKNKIMKYENNTENKMKKTKSMTKLANINNDRENYVDNKNKQNFDQTELISYGDGKKITFNNIQNTEESEKNSKQSKVNKRINNIFSPKMSNSPLNNKNNKDMNRSLSPSNCSISVTSSINKNKRNTKSIVKKQINHINKVVGDFSSTKYLNEFKFEKNSKEKNQNLKKSPDKKREENILNEINNRYNLNKINTKAKVVNGRNIAMMRQRNNNNPNLHNNLTKINPKMQNLNYNNNNKNLNSSKSKTPKREREIIFDNKSLSEKTCSDIVDNLDNKIKFNNSNHQSNTNINGPIYSSDKSNIYLYQNLDNKMIPNNSMISNNVSNLNFSYDNPNNQKMYNFNNYGGKIYQNDHINNNYNPSILNNNIPNAYSTNNPSFENTNTIYNYKI